MSLKMNSSLRFPENRKLNCKIDTFLVDPSVRSDVRKNLHMFSVLGYGDSNGDQELVLPSSSTMVSSHSGQCWKDKVVNIKQELLRQIKTYKRCISIKEKHLHRQQAALRRLVQCAKVSPLLASEIVGRESGHGGMHHWVSREKLECVASIGGKRCHTSSLPYSKYCLQHILMDNKQVLYKQCSAIDPGTQKQCQKPVLEILQDKPYCKTHMSSVALSAELKKASSKFNLSSGKSSTGRRKVSPIRAKKTKVTEPVKPVLSKPNPPPLSLPSPNEPLLGQVSAPPSAGWSSVDNEGDMKRIQGVEMIGDNSLLPITPTLNNDMPLSFASNDTKTDSLLPFSPDSVSPFSCPPLPPPPQVGLLPLDSTLQGNILDNSSSGEET